MASTFPRLSLDPQTPLDPNSIRPLVSPKGWAGAGLGIGMSWGGGTPFVENEHKIKLSKFL